MFAIQVNSVPVVFAKFFAESDRDAALEAIPVGTDRVVFVDTGATPVLAEAIAALLNDGIEVIVRDHHRGEGRTPEAAEQIEQLLGERARIVTRAKAPACAELVEVGEFAEVGTVIVADPDLDGLTAAMKAAGVSYDGLDADATVFDVRPQQSAETLTPLGWVAVRALATLPPFNKERPEVAENAKRDLFQRFVLAARGDVEARSALESAVADYEAQVSEAERLLAESMSEPVSGVVLVDAVGAARSDLNTLTQGMEVGGAIVTVVRKDFGPIAAKFGVQYSLAVVRDRQEELDLRELVPAGMESSPEAGLLSNTSFLLHCSEVVWQSTILPALRQRLSG